MTAISAEASQVSSAQDSTCSPLRSQQSHSAAITIGLTSQRRISKRSLPCHSKKERLRQVVSDRVTRCRARQIAPKATVTPR